MGSLWQPIALGGNNVDRTSQNRYTLSVDAGTGQETAGSVTQQELANRYH